MNNYIYILREDFYGEWAIECGATELISASTNLETILQDLEKSLLIEKEQDSNRILGDDINNQNVDFLISEAKNKIELEKQDIYCIDVYIDKINCINYTNNASLIIERLELK